MPVEDWRRGTPMAAKQPPGRKKVTTRVGPGRPSRFRPEYVEQARKLCLLGSTDQKLADFFEVQVMTIQRWKIAHPEFREAVHAGKGAADLEVVSALMQRALGYSHPEVDIRVVNGEIVKTAIVKHYPPDTPAAIFWLTNRQPQDWKARREELDPETGAPPPVRVEVAVVDARKPG